MDRSLEGSSDRLFVSLWTITSWLPLSLEFSRQEYWSGLPFPAPGDLSDPLETGMELHGQVGDRDRSLSIASRALVG